VTDAALAPPSARRGALREAGVVVLGSLVAAIAFTWPLVLHLNSRARDLIDTLFQAWTIDWVQHALSNGMNPYDANIFAPEQTSLAYSDTLLGVAIPTFPLRWLGMTPIGVLNVTIIVGLAAAAAAAYLFARLVTGSRLVAVVAGAAYAFGPFGALSERHVHVAVRAGVPLAAAAAWWLADRARERRPIAWPAVALVAVVTWQATVSFYPGTYALVTAFVVLAVRWRSLDRRGLLAGAGALVLSAVILGLLAIPNLVVSGRDPNYEFTLDNFTPFGANFTHVDPDVAVWGSVLGLDDSDTMRLAVFPGLLVLVFAIAGLVHAWRRHGRERSAAIAGLALTVVGAVLAIGTAATGWRQYAPYRLLYELVPPFNALRATGRAWMIGLLGLGLLAGLGVKAFAGWLADRFPSTVGSGRAKVVPAVVGTIVVVLVLLEGFDPWFDRPTARVPAVDRELAQLAEGGVLYLPMNTSDEVDIGYFQQPKNLYGATEHHRRTPNGYSGYLPESYLRQSRALRDLPDDDAIALLRRIGVRYIVVHRDVAGTPWAALRNPDAATPLELVGTYGPDLLYEVPR
jgi:hypothetical protein